MGIFCFDRELKPPKKALNVLKILLSQLWKSGVYDQGGKSHFRKKIKFCFFEKHVSVRFTGYLFQKEKLASYKTPEKDLRQNRIYYAIELFSQTFFSLYFLGRGLFVVTQSFFPAVNTPAFPLPYPAPILVI